MSQINNLRPLSFVSIRGFGDNPIIVQISLDSRFFVLSTNYLLSPIIALPDLIDEFIGTQPSLIQENKNIYKGIIEKIYDLNTNSSDIKCNIDDPLLVVRSFSYLKKSHSNIFSEIETFTDDIYLEAIKKALEQDEKIKSFHHNLINTIKKNGL